MRNEFNRRWVLASRPKSAALELDTFKFEEVPVPEIGDGEFLIRNLVLSFDPALRGQINDVPSYVPPVQIGEAMRAGGVGQVVESKHPDFKPGDLVQGQLGWQDYSVAKAAQKLAAGVTPGMALSVLGGTGLTAYFGMEEIGKPVVGDVVVVSGAAGATGSIAGQIAKIMGAKTVIGIAGGAAKCKWLTSEANFDAAIDYKNEDVGKRLSELAPNGINVYFDNVGGEILDECLARIAFKARIVLCGGISSGYGLDRGKGPSNYFSLIIRSGRMEGFIVLNYASRFGEAAAQLRKWVDEGRLVSREDIVEGLENAPKTLQGLFSGANFGKQLLKIADPDNL